MKGPGPSAQGRDAHDSAKLVFDNVPAPPMPLTEQERLLLRIARRRDAQEFAALDQANRQREEDAEQAQFESFFAEPEPTTPAPTGPEPTGDTSWNPALPLPLPSLDAR